MTPAELNAYVLIFGALVNIGRDAVSVVRNILASEGRTETEINAVLLHVQQESVQRRAVSYAIAFGQE